MMDGGHCSRNVHFFAPTLEVKYLKSRIMLHCLDSSRNMSIKIIIRYIRKYTNHWEELGITNILFPLLVRTALVFQ